MTTLLDIINHPSLNRFAALLRVTIDPDWRQAHPATFYPAWDRLAGTGLTIAAQGSMHRDHDTEVEAIVTALTEIITGMIDADGRLALYSDTDLHWLLDAAQAYRRGLLAVLFAKVYTGGETNTPAEIAELTGTSESYWRNHAAGGDIPGVVKKGKQWLIPVAIAQAWRERELLTL